MRVMREEMTKAFLFPDISDAFGVTAGNIIVRR
jgi:hypothetical protein